jgi:hypothetical protein
LPAWRPAAASEIVRFENINDEDLLDEAFTLTRPVTLHVHCEGGGDGDDDGMYAYGWILAAGSREVVWSLTPENSQQRHDRNYVFDGDVPLPAGDYVAYYAGYGKWRSQQKIVKFLGKELWRFEIDNDRYKRSQRDSKSWGLRIETRNADDASVRAEPAPRRDNPLVLVQIIGIEDDQFEQQGFTLPERMAVTVYCEGEFAGGGDGDSPADGGWILDAETRKRVWALGPDNFKHAGGAPKNKLARETITLPAGNYLVFYSTDGSHSAGSWNAPPPYDPDYWGITVWATNAAQARRVKPYRDEDTGRSIVSLIEQGSDSYVTQGLTLVKPAQVRVYALGEFAHGEFADQGWIEGFDSHRRVWEMRERNTQPAGGSYKNRCADEIIDLPAGDYVVYYQTDDSHAYQDWNDSAPHDPNHWGITLYGVRNFDRNNFKLFDAEKREESGKQYLVRMIKMGSDADEERKFRIDRPTRVRIICLGEGDADQVYDYGWIESSDDRRPVWEMTPRNTRHAGGAAKNRIYDGTIMLDKGDYVAHYQTDGSHAYGDWNATPPPQPHLWGLSVSVETANP